MAVSADTQVRRWDGRGIRAFMHGSYGRRYGCLQVIKLDSEGGPMPRGLKRTWRRDRLLGHILERLLGREGFSREAWWTALCGIYKTWKGSENKESGLRPAGR